MEHILMWHLHELSLPYIFMENIFVNSVRFIFESDLAYFTIKRTFICIFIYWLKLFSLVSKFSWIRCSHLEYKLTGINTCNMESNTNCYRD